jgi:hypothetical protein
MSKMLITPHEDKEHLHDLRAQRAQKSTPLSIASMATPNIGWQDSKSQMWPQELVLQQKKFKKRKRLKHRRKAVITVALVNAEKFLWPRSSKAREQGTTKNGADHPTMR